MDVEQRQFDRQVYATATVAPGASTVAEISITVRTATGKPSTACGWFYLYLSDSPAGVGLTAVTASGAVGAKGANGADIQFFVGKKAQWVQQNGSGSPYILSITDAAKTPFRVCVQIGGVTQVLATLTAASYGP